MTPMTAMSMGDWGRPTLVQGSDGPSVRELQARLDQGGEALAIDGVFGPLTRAAVVRFQRARGLAPDGIVGPMTWGALDTAQPAATDPTQIWMSNFTPDSGGTWLLPRLVGIARAKELLMLGRELEVQSDFAKRVQSSTISLTP